MGTTPWKQVMADGSVRRHQYRCVADRIIWTVGTDHLVPVDEAGNALQSHLGRPGSARQ
jgi:hypothetical protein